MLQVKISTLRFPCIRRFDWSDCDVSNRIPWNVGTASTHIRPGESSPRWRQDILRRRTEKFDVP